MRQHKAIPYHKEINDLLASFNAPHRTVNPDLFCLRLKEIDKDIYLPPFIRGFYFVALLLNGDKTKIEFTDNKLFNKKNILVFQPPGLVYSFYRHRETAGYIIYFKQECFSFFKPAIEKEFPFFQNLLTDAVELPAEKFSELSPHFEEVFQAYEKNHETTHKVACLKMLALLYQLNDVVAFNQYQDRPVTPQNALLRRFTRLVNHHYIEKRTVSEYAELLSITSNHLSQSIKTASGKNALSFINERLLSEAKSLISFTDFDMNEITYRLHFSDPANFGKFFKKHTGQTPLEFRSNAAG